MSGFPPVPLYPNGYDSDYTLFLVYNTTEAQTTADTDAWADEIPVRPRTSDQDEVWADNGYANIAGELFYYDAVQKNSNGKVCRLKRCTRQLGGRPSQFNSKGTWVRGFVIAEHHNQLVDTTLLVERFVGENFSEDVTTLDWRIRHLADSPILADDVCPDCQFTYEVLSTSPITGTVVSYDLNIIGNASFVLQFGDGTQTTSQKSGTHTYAPGATIDPIAILTGPDCQMVQSPIIRNSPNTPTPTVQSPPFTIDIPIPPEIPSLIIPSIVITGPTITVPPINFPCVNPNGIPSVIITRPPLNIPSQINFNPPTIPSQITITGMGIPSMILGPSIIIPSVVEFGNIPTIPNMMMFGPAPPIPPIQISPCQLPPIQTMPISFENSPDIPSVIQLEFTSGFSELAEAISSLKMPSVIDVRLVGNTEPVSVVFINPATGDSCGGCPSGTHDLSNIHGGGPGGGGGGGPGPGGMSSISGLSLIAAKNQPRVYGLGAPSFDPASIVSATLKAIQEIPIKVPEVKIPDIKMDWGNTPTLKAVLKIEKPQRRNLVRDTDEEVIHTAEVPFDGEFKIAPPIIPDIKIKHDLPSTIGIKHDLTDLKLTNDNVPTEISLVLPKEELRVSVVPFSLPDLRFDRTSLEGISIPVKMPEDLPAINVKFPDQMPFIEVKFPKDIPGITLEIPENARIPLVYEGPPIPVAPVKINFFSEGDEGDDSDAPCFRLVACPRR